MRNSFAPPTLDSLVDLACRDGVDIRPTLLRVLTDLYVQRPTHSAEEEVQYTELALGLIDAVDAPTREAVASRLASYPAAPAAILSRLGRTPSTTAAPPSPAKREPDLAELFFAANSAERRLILTNLDAAPAEPLPRRAAVSSDVIGQLERAALQHNEGEFCRTLERALGVSRALAERITRDPSGEPIVIAARALGMKAAVLQRILLFLNPQVGQSVGRVFDLANLFDELSPASADRMLAIWRQTGGQAKRYEPQHWDDERRSARSQATHAGHRAASGREPLPSHIKSNEH